MSDGPLITVYWARRDHARPGLIELLSKEECLRRVSYLREADRQRFAVAAALLRVAAATRLGIAPNAVIVRRDCPDCSRPHGRPTLPGTRLEVSVTHTEELIGVALGADGRLGLDAETITARTEPLAEVLDEREQAELATLPAAQRPAGFLRYWVRKEAVLKCTGEGLRTAPSKLRVSAPGEPGAILEWADHPGQAAAIRLTDLAASPGTLASLAVLDAHPPLVRESPADALLATVAEP